MAAAGTAGTGRGDEPSGAVVAQLFPDRREAIHLYVDLLTSEGVLRGLIGPRETDRIWTRHILNCAVVGPAFAPAARVCDLGSGAGLPGVVIALVRPDLDVVLLEPLQRRVTFLTEVIDRLGLSRCSVLHARAEEVAAGAGFDAVTARAVAPLDRLSRWALPLLRPGGELVALRGARAVEELAAARPLLDRLGVTATRVERFGHGIVEPPTTVVRIASGRTPIRTGG